MLGVAGQRESGQANKAIIKLFYSIKKLYAVGEFINEEYYRI
jgi:hypothetical protein